MEGSQPGTGTEQVVHRASGPEPENQRTDRHEWRPDHTTGNGERETWTGSCKRGKRRELSEIFENGLVIYIPRRRINMFRKFVVPF